MTNTTETERHLLARLSEALERQDTGCADPGEVDLARFELREFYRSLGMHP
jgi:hypothetical protein